MNKPKLFFTIFIVTIIITRLFLLLYPIPSPTVGDFRTHHYMFGIVIVMVGLLLKNIPLYAGGFGLFIDELGYLLIGGTTHADNYSTPSLMLLCLCIILVYINRQHLVRWHYTKDI